MVRAKLVLWDIDHTLINAGGVGAEMFTQALEQVMGRPSRMLANMAGRTDTVILADTLELHGLTPSAELFDRFAAALAANYTPHQRDRLRTHGHVLPGAAEALAALAARPDVVQSTLTGNVKPVAIIKLATFGLDQWIDFDAGAYGSEASARADLVPLARGRAAARYGTSFAGTATILIGDTPADIEAALANGAAIIAVATGGSSPADLKAAGAEIVLPDLERTTELLAAISQLPT
ncbi:MAG TPA: haloacid dehalogenase-like hydrolase [Mycobacteriales bacterium]|nr:haloacid dehalogenase-like hydrolase [Mycobacteriales bacterium]